MIMRVIVMVIMPIKGFRAAHEGVQPFQPVDQALFQQKIQRTIHGGRRGLGAALLQLIKQRIGANWRLSLQHQAQHIAAKRRKLHTTLLAKRLGLFQRCHRMTRTMHAASYQKSPVL